MVLKLFSIFLFITLIFFDLSQAKIEDDNKHISIKQDGDEEENPFEADKENLEIKQVKVLKENENVFDVINDDDSEDPDQDSNYTTKSSCDDQKKSEKSLHKQSKIGFAKIQLFFVSRCRAKRGMKKIFRDKEKFCAIRSRLTKTLFL